MLVILAILAAAGTAGMSGYIRHAKQSARESVARSIFMAAQTALTHEYNQDPEYYTNNRSPVLPAGDFLTADEAAKLQHSPPALVYLKQDQGTGNATQPLYKMLAPYINDKSLLYDSILIEYNRETGKVLSAFYSEVEDVTLGYGAGGSYNVANRDEASLEAGEVGYYGVDSTGEVIRPDPIDLTDYSVRLIDHTDSTVQGKGYYGLLTAEIEIDREQLTDDSTNVYELDIIPTKGTVETLTFSYAYDAANCDFTIKALLDAGVRATADALAAPRSVQGSVNGQPVERKIPIFYIPPEGAITSGKIVIVLDGVQSLGAENDIGIRTNFPSITGGFLFGELIIKKGQRYQDSVYSDDADNRPVHAFYGNDSSTDKSRLTVMSVRHLNNVRYAGEDDNFVQTQNVYMWDYDLQKLNFTPLCNRFDVTAGMTGYGFAGSYTGNANYAIYDLNIDLTQQTIPATRSEEDTTLYNAGLFDTIRSGKRVSNVRFAASAPVYQEKNGGLRVLQLGTDVEAVLDAIACVRGIDYAGGVAAVNKGTIENCTMLGAVYADEERDAPEDGCAGGIAGLNSNGVIARCATQCAVMGEKYAGGIAGRNEGTIRYCEAGTASWRDAGDSTRLYASGVPQYGAAASANGAYKTDYGTANNTFHVSIKKANGHAGGIAGEVAGTNSKVTGCVNACKVEAGNLRKVQDGNGNEQTVGQVTGGSAGGVAGALNVPISEEDTSYIAIESCYNAGAVYATQYAGGLVGYLDSGRMSSCYNTGYVNRERDTTGSLEYKADKTYYLPGETRNLGASGTNYSGGIVGYGDESAVIRYCYSAQYTGDAYGGAVGVLHENARLENCAFQHNILNNTSDYYTDDGAHAPVKQTSGGASKYAVAELLTMPTVKWGDASRLTDGQLMNPSGVFKYRLPYLLTAPDNSALPPHRTPYNQAIEHYGRISLSGTLTRDAEIICRFYLAPPEGYICLRDGNLGASEGLLTCIPLYEEDGHNSLQDLRNAAAQNTWHAIYGYKKDFESILKSDQPNYTLEARARALNAATSETDALRIAEGYSYEYQLRMVYASQNDKYTPIPDTVKYLVAELYNTKKGSEHSTRYTAKADLGRTLITLTRPTSTVTALCLSGVQLGSTAKLDIDFEYSQMGGTPIKQTITLNGDKLAHAPTTYDQTLFGEGVNVLSARIGFSAGGPVTDTLLAQRFPFYVTPTGEICIVLWTPDVTTVQGYTQYDRKVPNGLHPIDAEETMTVRVSQTEGNTTIILAEKVYRYWAE